MQKLIELSKSVSRCDQLGVVYDDRLDCKFKAAKHSKVINTASLAHATLLRKPTQFKREPEQPLARQLQDAGTQDRSEWESNEARKRLSLLAREPQAGTARLKSAELAMKDNESFHL